MFGIEQKGLWARALGGLALLGASIPALQDENDPMQGETKERWQRLCEQAATEQDSKRLMLLIKEISELLDAKEKRLQERGTEAKSAA